MIEIKLKSKIAFLLITGIFFASLSFELQPKSSEKIYNINNTFGASATSGKIHINNNWTATKSAGICTGEGTINNPYIIKDLEIDGGGNGSCILIENSDAFFRIENCTVYNSGSSYTDGGIKVLNSANGLIVNNEAFSHGMNAITLYHSNDTIVTGNNCYLCTGILIEYCENINVYLNNLIGEGHILAVDFSSYNSTIRWWSPQQLSYRYKGRSYTSYLGNYYNAYVDGAQDANGDGIGDGWHTIDPHKPTPIVIDKYPLMETIENYDITNDIGLIPGYGLFMFLGIIGLTLAISIIIYKKKYL